MNFLFLSNSTVEITVWNAIVMGTWLRQCNYESGRRLTSFILVISVLDNVFCLVGTMLLTRRMICYHQRRIMSHSIRGNKWGNGILDGVFFDAGAKCRCLVGCDGWRLSQPSFVNRQVGSGQYIHNPVEITMVTMSAGIIRYVGKITFTNVLFRYLKLA